MTDPMTVKFLRVIGHRAHHPVVLAIVDGHRVTWNGGPEWTTECECPEDGDCPHLDAVLDLLDDRVLGDAS